MVENEKRSGNGSNNRWVTTMGFATSFATITVTLLLFFCILHALRTWYWSSKPPLGPLAPHVQHGISGKLAALVRPDVATDVVRRSYSDMTLTAIRQTIRDIEAAVAVELRASTVVFDTIEPLQEVLRNTARGEAGEESRRDDPQGWIAMHSVWNRARKAWMPDPERAHWDYVAFLCVDARGEGRIEFKSTGKKYVMAAGDVIAASAGPESRFRAEGQFIALGFMARPFRSRNAYVERQRHLCVQRIWCGGEEQE